MVRFSLQDIFGMLTLAPISAGVVYAVEVISGAVLYYFDPVDSIASATGWSLHEKHALFLITLSASYCIVFGGMVVSAMLLLLFLRSRWTTLVAFSMPFGILCLSCLRFWMMASPANSNMVSFVAKTSIVPVLLAVCLLVFGWRFTKCMPTHESNGKTGFFQQQPRQRCFIAATLVIYLSTSAYGWYGMVSFRTEMIRVLRDLEQREQQ